MYVFHCLTSPVSGVFPLAIQQIKINININIMIITYLGNKRIG